MNQQVTATTSMIHALSMAVFIAIALLMGFATPSLAAEPPVPRWQPRDFSFKSNSAPTNPFKVDFSADVVGPDGVTLKTLGFYDGEGTWKLSISPTVQGSRTLATHSSVPNLDGQKSPSIVSPIQPPRFTAAFASIPNAPFS